MGDSFIPLGADPGSIARRSATAKRPSSTRDGTVDVFHHDEVVITERKVVSYKGTVGTFRIPGLAGTAGQVLYAIHNASSTTLCDVESMNVSMFDTAAKVVAPPIIRAWKFTAVPTGGAAVPKRGTDTAHGTTGDTAITVWQGASADGTGVTLNVTRPANMWISQAPALRSLTLVGESTEKETGMLAFTGPVTLRQTEGICIYLDYNLATMNPVTDMWNVDSVWKEYIAF